MANYEKKCWYCGSKNMEPVETYFQCRDCGATHVSVLNTTASGITEVDARTGRSPRPGHDTQYRVSGQLARSSSRARQAKIEEAKGGTGARS